MSGNNEKQDYSDFLMIMLIIGALCFQAMITYKYDWFVTIWYFFKYPIYQIIAFIPDKILDYYGSIYFWNSGFTDNIKGVSKIFNDYSLAQFVNEDFMDSELKNNNVTLRQFVSFVNKQTTFIYLPFVLVFLFYIKNKIQSKERFNGRHDIYSLGVKESAVWHEIKPVIYESNDFIDTSSLDKGWYSMSKKPHNYFIDNNLLDVFKNKNKDDFENYGTDYFKININRMYEHFVDNLGSPIGNLRDLAPYKKYLLAVTTSKIMKDKKLNTELIKNLSIMYSSMPKTKKFKIFSIYSTFKENNKTKKIIKRIKKEIKIAKKEVDRDVKYIMDKYFPSDKYKTNLITRKKVLIERSKYPEQIDLILKNHFYEKTFFAGLLERSRKAGVLAPAQFIWLKKIDKEFWYMMSQVGRTASFPECAGAWSHFIAEKTVGRKLVSPIVINAIYAADSHMQKTHKNYEPINK
jgi:hypothetical protein